MKLKNMGYDDNFLIRNSGGENSLVVKVMEYINDELKIIGENKYKNEFVFGIEKEFLLNKVWKLRGSKRKSDENLIRKSVSLYRRINEGCIIKII